MSSGIQARDARDEAIAHVQRLVLFDAKRLDGVLEDAFVQLRKPSSPDMATR